jgi:hypothetical protein
MREFKGLTIAIFSMKLAGYLMFNGYPMAKLPEDNTIDNTKMVFYFNNTIAIQQEIDNYFKQYPKKAFSKA